MARAIEKVRNGEGRNNTGFWLAVQLRDLGFSLEETIEIGEAQYVPEVKYQGNHPYTGHEFRNTCGSVHRHPRPDRGPWARQEAQPEIVIDDQARVKAEQVDGALRRQRNRAKYIALTRGEGPLMALAGFVKYACETHLGLSWKSPEAKAITLHLLYQYRLEDTSHEERNWAAHKAKVIQRVEGTLYRLRGVGIETDRAWTWRGLAERTGCSRRSAERWLEQLELHGLVIRKGSRGEAAELREEAKRVGYSLTEEEERKLAEIEAGRFVFTEAGKSALAKASAEAFRGRRIHWGPRTPEGLYDAQPAVQEAVASAPTRREPPADAIHCHPTPPVRSFVPPYDPAALSHPACFGWSDHTIDPLQGPAKSLTEARRDLHLSGRLGKCLGNWLRSSDGDPEVRCCDVVYQTKDESTCRRTIWTETYSADLLLRFLVEFREEVLGHWRSRLDRLRRRYPGFGTGVRIRQLEVLIDRLESLPDLERDQPERSARSRERLVCEQARLLARRVGLTRISTADPSPAIRNGPNSPRPNPPPSFVDLRCEEAAA